MSKKPAKKHAKRLDRSDGADAFIRESEPRSGLKDDLAQRLAEEYLRSAASGDDSDEQSRDELLVEELGGPFIESGPEQEFAVGDRSTRPDPEEERNALPEAVGPLAIASVDEETLTCPDLTRGRDPT